MHRVLLYHIDNFLLLVLHTGMATGIRIASSLTSRSRCTRIEVTPLEPGQRSYLRLRFFTTSLPPSLSHEGGRYKITDPLFPPRLGEIGVQASMFSEGLTKTRYANFLQQLHRSWNLIESFAASFVAMNFIGAVRYVEIPVRDRSWG